MGFGLCNAPATFSRAMGLVLRGLTYKQVLAYLDDVVIIGKSFQDHLENLEEVLQRFRQYHLKLKPKKCDIFQTEIKFLGRHVTSEGLSVQEEKVKAVMDWPVPNSKTELLSFLGTVNYHRDFICQFAKLAGPLYQRVQTSKPSNFQWGKEEQTAFEELKRALVVAPLLSFPNNQDRFFLDCDASNTAIGAELLQIQGGEEKVISYSSYILTPAQKRYCTTRKELLALVVFTRHFRHYLLGRPFTCRTDHASLAWLMRFKKLEGQLARWCEELAQFDMVILHRSGKTHCNADGISRIPDRMISCDCYVAGQDLESLPCGGCPYCRRCQEQWSRFESDVDDVVPMVVRQIGTELVDPMDSPDLRPEETEMLGYTAKELSDRQAGDPDLAPVLTWLQGSASSINLGATHTRGPEPAPVLTRLQGSVSNDKRSQTGEPASAQVLTVSQEVEPRGAQGGDPDLAPVLTRLQDTGPTEAELFLQSAATKHLWRCKSQLKLMDGVLYYEWDEGLHTKLKLVVPHSLQQEVISCLHDTRAAGHLGRDKTIGRLKASYYWLGMSKDVSLYIATCGTCTVNKKKNHTPRAELESYQAGVPMERVHLDILGPFVESNRGNRYVLMIVDQFTKWVSCIPLPDQAAETMAWSFYEYFISFFGCPIQIHTDQGRNFDGNYFRALCELLQIVKTRTTPYRPSSNGQVERYNKVVLQFIRCYLDGKQKDWDKYIATVGMSIRASVSRSTGFTPNFMMFGRELHMPTDILMGVASVNSNASFPAQHAVNITNIMRSTFQEVRENLGVVQKRQKRLYDTKAYQRTFEAGDLVYKLDSSTKVGQSKKLQPIYRGPYLVTKVLSPALFRIDDRNKSGVVHHDRLTLCKDRTIPLWLRQRRHKLLEEEGPVPEEPTILGTVLTSNPDPRPMGQAEEFDVTALEVPLITGAVLTEDPVQSGTSPHGKEKEGQNPELDSDAEPKELGSTAPFPGGVVAFDPGGSGEEMEENPYPLVGAEPGTLGLDQLFTTRSGRHTRRPRHLEGYV